MPWISRLLAACAALTGSAFAAPAVSPEAPLTARLSEVIDGDTIRVWLDGVEETVRYLAIEAPELDEPGGNEARRVHEELLTGGRLWLECRRDDDGRLVRDGRKRLLAYVFADEEGKSCLNLELVRRGAARVGVRAVRDDTPDDDFALKRLGEMTAAQVAAAKARAGWWGKGDPHVASDFLVVFVKFWGKDETVWLLNRGKSAVELTAGWELSDEGGRNATVLGRRVPVDRLPLPPGGLCRIHSGPAAAETRMEVRSGGVDLRWTRSRVWNNTGDRATLRDADGGVVYSYAYRASGN